MFQKEVAERIIATPNQKKYGRISILTNARLDVKFACNSCGTTNHPERKDLPEYDEDLNNWINNILRYME